MEKRNIAVIGGSAESLSALKELVGELPADFPSWLTSLETATKKAADVK